MTQSLAGDFSTYSKARLDDNKSAMETRRSSRTHSRTACRPEAEMGDMHEAECQDELEKSPSCHRRDGQETVHAPISLLLSHSPLLHACYFLSIISPQVGSFRKIKWPFCTACGNRLLKQTRG